MRVNMKERYKWHDLRKNHEDLPTVDYGVLVVCRNRCYVVRRGRWLKEEVLSNGIGNYIAWRYIEEFRW